MKNATFYVEGLPYDKAEYATVVAQRFSKRYNRPIKIEVTYTDDELITHHHVEYATISVKRVIVGELFC